MKLHCISDVEYNELVFKLIFQAANFQAGLSLSPAGIPNIGYGFDLRDENMLLPVLEALGFDVSGRQLKDQALVAEREFINRIRRVFVEFDGKQHPNEAAESLNNAVQSILAARLTDKRYPRCHHYKRAARFVFPDKPALKQCVNAITRNLEKTVDRWLMAFDLELVNRNPQLFARKSTERTVLLSLAYQGIIGLKPNKSPMFPALGNTFLLDDRALAWYYLRYTAFSGDVKPISTVMQRYYESELFGLYDDGVDGATITLGQCKKIFAVYQEYKEYMLGHERQFGPYITEANRHFGLAGAKAIRTLEQSLAMANDRIQAARSATTARTSAPATHKAEAPNAEGKKDNVHYLHTAVAR